MPEYETIAMCGPLCGVDDREAIIRFNDICNAYGLDTISVGAAVAFAMECFEHGVLTRDDAGLELRWGDGAAMVALTEMMARREGIGAALADGTVVAARSFGNGADALRRARRRPGAAGARPALLPEPRADLPARPDAGAPLPRRQQLDRRHRRLGARRPTSTTTPTSASRTRSPPRCAT